MGAISQCPSPTGKLAPMPTRQVPLQRVVPAGPEERWSTSVPAVLGLVFGILAVVGPLLPMRLSLVFVLALVALLLGSIGMIQGTRPGITGRGVAIAGVLLACSGLAVAVNVAVGLS